MNIETRARDAARRAQGAVQMIEVPQSDEVVNERRRQHHKRNAIICGLAVIVLLAGSAAAIATTRKADPAVVTHQPVHHAVLEFREVKGYLAFGTAPVRGQTACSSKTLTPPEKVTATVPQVILPDKADKFGKHQLC